MRTLYHGTSSVLLDQIKAEGLQPRRDRKSIWDEYQSAPDRVYLTNAYALFYAFNAVNELGGNGVVFKVSVYDEYLVADEDALSQTNVTDEGFEFLQKMDLKQKFDFWQLEAPKYPHLADWSLDALGTVAHMDFIPWCDEGAINQVFDYGITKFVEFELGDLPFMFDPTITLMNYKILGKRYSDALEKFVESDGKEGRQLDGLIPDGFGMAEPKEMIEEMKSNLKA